MSDFHSFRFRRSLLLSAFLLLLPLGSRLSAESRDFVHPGIAYSAKRIELVRSKIEQNENPWAEVWAELRGARAASLDWEPKPHAVVERGPYKRPDIGSSEFSNDAFAAHVHAVCWALSGREAHAEKAAEILNAWSGTLETVTNHDAALLVGMEAYDFTIAAELLKYTWDGWSGSGQQRFAKMQREVWYPVIKDFYPTANGNWDASMLQSMAAMGVYLEDSEMYERARTYFLRGKGNGAIGNYFKPSGQCQESGRDQGHTQMGLEFLANTCEIAWLQGDDLYGAMDNRLLAGFEYTGKYNLGNEVPFEPYRSYRGRYFFQSISDKGRGNYRPMWEKVFRHYHHRKGLEAPFTGQVIRRLRSGEAWEGKRGKSQGVKQSLDTLMFSVGPIPNS